MEGMNPLPLSVMGFGWLVSCEKCTSLYCEVSNAIIESLEMALFWSGPWTIKGQYQVCFLSCFILIQFIVKSENQIRQCFD